MKNFLKIILVILILLAFFNCDTDNGTSRVKFYNTSDEWALDLKINGIEFNDVSSDHKSPYERLTVGTYRIYGKVGTTNLKKSSIKIDANKDYEIVINPSGATRVNRVW